MANGQLTAEDVDRLLANQTKRSGHVDLFLAEEAKKSLGHEVYHRRVDIPPDRVDRLKDSLRNLVERDKKFRSEQALNAFVIKHFTEGSIKGVVVLGPTLLIGAAALPTVAGAAALFIANKSAEAVIKGYEKLSRNLVRSNLKTALRKLEENIESPEERRSVLEEQDPKLFIQKIQEKTGILFDPSLEDIPSEDQDLVNSYYVRGVAKIMAEGFEHLDNVKQVQDEDIEANRTAISKLARTFGTYATENQKKLQKVIETQNNISSKLDEVNKRVGKTEQGVQLMQELMYGKMSPTEQLDALKRGMFLDMPEPEREQLIKDTEAASNRDQFNKDLASYLNGAQLLVNIAGNIPGISPEVVRTASIAVSVGNHAVEAFTAFSSGNVLAGISALSGILGIGGGRDIAGERHNELRDMLNSIYDVVGNISERLQFLEENQKRMIDLQKVTIEAIQRLGEQVAQNHHEVMDKLEDIHVDVRQIINLLRIDPLLEYRRCRNLIVDPIDNHVITNTSARKYPSYQELKGYFSRKSKRVDYDICTLRLGETTIEGGQFNPIVFRLHTYLGENKELDNYVNSVEAGYKPSLEFLLTDSFFSQSAERRIASLLSPTINIELLDEKIKSFNDGVELKPNWQADFPAPLSELLKNVLFPQMVEMHTNYVLNIHLYAQFFNSETEKLFSLDELVNPGKDPISQEGFELLLQAKRLVDTTIAQQVLLSGDILLRSMADLFWQNTADASATVKNGYLKSVEILKNNSLLAKNFLTYIFKREVLSKSNLLTYWAALRIGNNPTLLKNITSDSWVFNWSDKPINETGVPEGWSVKLGEKYFPLPTFEDMTSGSLAYPNETYMLLGLRSRILDEMSTYSFYDDMTPEGRLDFNELLLNSI